MEIWRDIPSYKGYYMASNMGRIKSLRNNKILAQNYQNGGYLTVSLSVNGRHKVCTVHRLVAMAFIDNPSGYRDVNHKDGRKDNNNISNLEWVSHSDNIKHSYIQLKQRRNDVAVICVETNQMFNSILEASKKAGVSPSAIQHAISGITKKAGGYTWARL